MITISQEEFGPVLLDTIYQGKIEAEYDNQGQIVINTNWFYWNDGTIRNEPDPEFSDDPTDA